MVYFKAGGSRCPPTNCERTNIAKNAVALKCMTTNRESTMRQVQASAAKTRFAELLRIVERGETVVITRRGKPVARLVPDKEGSKSGVAQVKEQISALRSEMPRLTIREILQSRHKGHRF